MALTTTNLPTLYEYYTAGGIKSGLSANQPSFTLNGKNISLYSGAMHYFRIPKKYWRDRLRKLRASGLNAVETYVPWNLHEPRNGTFDFGKGGSDMQEFLDVHEYLKIAQEEDLFAIVRPGPYICAEWEWGGLPSWLLRENNIKVRTSDSVYMGYVKRYFNILLPILAALQFMNGGPVIALQVENEYGSSPQRDLRYIQQLYDIHKENGIRELLFTSDGSGPSTSGTIPEILFQTVNFGSNPTSALDALAKKQPGRPLMVTEYWDGWFDHWSEQHHTQSASNFRETYDTILSYPASVNLYMFHGGTNFGFLNGANLDSNGYLQPTTTSYDYDAPISEAGDYTDKYKILKELLAQKNSVRTLIPEEPKIIPRVQYANVAIKEILNLDDIVSRSESVKSNNILPMEKLPINDGSGQSYGYTIYRKYNIDLNANATLTIKGHVYDTVVVLVNGQSISKPLTQSSDLNGFGYWKQKDSKIILTETSLKGATVDLLVENWGRNNFGDIYTQFKGLKDDVLLDQEKITEWNIVPLEFKRKWSESLVGWKKVTDLPKGPALYRGILTVDAEPVDTFVDLQDWTKGTVIINGFVLGKYARIGPQQTLYLPGPFLKSGDNEIIVFEHFLPKKELKFSKNPIFRTI